MPRIAHDLCDSMELRWRRLVAESRRVSVGAASADPEAVGLEPALLGRDQELAHLYGMIDRIEARGDALVVRGEAGIGKSALLASAGERAREQGATVVTTTGTQSETLLAFGGLHQLLLPFLDRRGSASGSAAQGARRRLRRRRRRCARCLPGRPGGPRRITEREADAPLLLVVEDAHWLDRSSAEVLAFVARRLEMEPVILLFAVRDGVPNDLDEAGLPDLALPGSTTMRRACSWK